MSTFQNCFDTSEEIGKWVTLLRFQLQSAHDNAGVVPLVDINNASVSQLLSYANTLKQFIDIGKGYQEPRDMAG